jgi:hypothetical protein
LFGDGGQYQLKMPAALLEVAAQGPLLLLCVLSSLTAAVRFSGLHHLMETSMMMPLLTLLKAEGLCVGVSCEGGGSVLHTRKVLWAQYPSCCCYYY